MHSTIRTCIGRSRVHEGDETDNVEDAERKEQ